MLRGVDCTVDYTTSELSVRRGAQTTRHVDWVGVFVSGDCTGLFWNGGLAHASAALVYDADMKAWALFADDGETPLERRAAPESLGCLAITELGDQWLLSGEHYETLESVVVLDGARVRSLDLVRPTAVLRAALQAAPRRTRAEVTAMLRDEIARDATLMSIRGGGDHLRDLFDLLPSEHRDNAPGTLFVRRDREPLLMVHKLFANGDMRMLAVQRRDVASFWGMQFYEYRAELPSAGVLQVHVHGALVMGLVIDGVELQLTEAPEQHFYGTSVAVRVVHTPAHAIDVPCTVHVMGSERVYAPVGQPLSTPLADGVLVTGNFAGGPDPLVVPLAPPHLCLTTLYMQAYSVYHLGLDPGAGAGNPLRAFTSRSVTVQGRFLLDLGPADSLLALPLVRTNVDLRLLPTPDDCAQLEIEHGRGPARFYSLAQPALLVGDRVVLAATTVDGEVAELTVWERDDHVVHVHLHDEDLFAPAFDDDDADLQAALQLSLDSFRTG